MRYVKTALKLAAETTLISTVGSIFWMALGQQVVNTYASGDYAIAGSGVTFWHFFVSIAPPLPAIPPHPVGNRVHRPEDGQDRGQKPAGREGLQQRAGPGGKRLCPGQTSPIDG